MILKNGQAYFKTLAMFPSVSIFHERNTLVLPHM